MFRCDNFPILQLLPLSRIFLKTGKSQMANNHVYNAYAYVI